MTQQSVMESTHPLQSLQDDRFIVAMRQAAAIMERSEYNGRLTKAIDLVLSGSVTLHEDGTATVKSGSHTYHLEPDCTCEDSQRRSLYCKHFLAVMLLKRTYERLYQPANNNGHKPEETPPAPETFGAPQAQWQCAQAPSSCTLKWQFNGIELLLTLRDDTDDALFARIRRVLPRIEEKVEAQRQKRQEEHSTTGEDASYCDIHQVTMKRSQNGKGYYHKAGEKPDGKAIWCRGK